MTDLTAEEREVFTVFFTEFMQGLRHWGKLIPKLKPKWKKTGVRKWQVMLRLKLLVQI